MRKKACENKDFCDAVMLSEDTKILEMNQYQVFVKASSVIYVDLESLIKKADECKNNPEKSSATKIDRHIPQQIFQCLH